MTWQLISDVDYSLMASPASGDSIIDFEELAADRLVIQATTATGQPTWHMAARSVYRQTLADFPDGPVTVESYGRRVRLNNLTLLDVPAGTEKPYVLRLLVPYWFTDMQIKLWSFTA